MAERSVISVHTKPEVSERLSRLATATQRSKSFLANEAIERYLAAEEQFLATIDQRAAGMDAGDGISSATLLDRFEGRMKAKFDRTTE